MFSCGCKIRALLAYLKNADVARCLEADMIVQESKECMSSTNCDEGNDCSNIAVTTETGASESEAVEDTIQVSLALSDLRRAVVELNPTTGGTWRATVHDF